MPATTGSTRTHYDPKFRADFIAKVQAGQSNAKTCAEMGINEKTGARWWSAHKRALIRSGVASANPPKTLAQIRGHTTARKAYNDFVFFRLMCFGRKTTPAFAKIAREMCDAVESGRKEYVCTNLFPGAGKTLFYQDFVCWLIARNRTIRIMWGSASDDIATMRVREIKLELQRVEPGEGNSEDIASGRAVRPRYCMTDLFGRFRPSAHHGTAWTSGELTVSTPGEGRNTGEGPPTSGPTLVAVGPKSRQLGKRANIIIWDDLWTRDENDNPERGNVIKRFFEHTVTTRLQPNGVLALVMQRLGPADLSRYVLDKMVPVIDLETGEETGFEQEYRHIVYPAHHDELCDGRHPAGRPAWDPDNPVMGHCLTDPLALPPQDYVRAKTKPTWLVEYQQRDVDPSGAVFREVWLTGGKDEDGEEYRGCLDRTRALWELPDDLPKTVASAMAVDVGQANYWGLVASCHAVGKDAEMEWVLAADHRKMPAGTAQGLLDWDFERDCFVGVMEDWYQMSKDLGVPFTHVVAETNAAQRHLFRQTHIIDRWQKSRSCRIISHETKNNKNDPKLGVESLLAIRFQLGAIRLPWLPGVTQNTMRTYYNEVVGYKQGSPTNDVVMAQWMRTLNRRRVERALAPVPVPNTADIPAWVRKMG